MAIASSALAVSAIVVGCAGSPTTRSTAVTQATRGENVLVPAPKSLTSECRRTARAVGYRVPCPAKIPKDLTQTGSNGPSTCTLHIIGPGGVGGCAKSWRGWVVGSSATADEHLVITASPKPLRNDAKVVNGPAWYPQARVEPLIRLTINGWRIRAVLVPQDTNEGSSFIHHVVLIWTVGDHTYGVGFHNVHGVEQTLELDRELVRGIKLVGR